MTDWKKLGLKAGIEIHQRLGTKHKLFCNCSTSFSEKPESLEVKRRLRPVAGETGEVDVAAMHEFLGKKKFIYKTYPHESCLIDTDSEPPRNVNPEALEIALEIAMLLNCEIPDEVHVMRKTVIDGSNTTGFQRTMVVALDGWVPTSFGRVGIQLVALEEESSQIINKGKEKTIFGLNRLGIPLVEIATSPNIKTPEQGKEVAEKLGMILRSSRVARGLGTIRQDVNISIKSGERVEIKGVQDLKGIPRLIEKEAKRQLSLIKKGQKVSKDVRKPEPDGTTTFLRPLPGAARMYPETDNVPVKIDSALVRKIKNQLPELLEKKRERLEKELGVDKQTLKSLEKVEKLDLFKQLSRLKVSKAFIAETLISYPKDIPKKHKGADPFLIKDNQVIEIFTRLDNGEISKDSIMDILADISLGKKPDASKYKLERVDIDKEVKSLIKQKPGLSFGAYMGILMGKYKGKVSGEEISKALKKSLK